MSICEWMVDFYLVIFFEMIGEGSITEIPNQHVQTRSPSPSNAEQVSLQIASKVAVLSCTLGAYCELELEALPLMATDARTWFYTTPEPRPYFIEERVNHTLWKNRLQGLSMICTRYTTPIQMEGSWNGMPVQFEFQPGKWFVLRAGREVKELIGVMRQILMMKPAFCYIDPNGLFCTEYHTDNWVERFKEIQGDPAYQSLRRLRKD